MAISYNNWQHLHTELKNHPSFRLLYANNYQAVVIGNRNKRAFIKGCTTLAMTRQALGMLYAKKVK